MKTGILVLLPAALLVVAGCSTTSFVEYRGQGVIEGKGGTVRSIDGIDFWENGEPNRKYRIVGVIDDSRQDKLLVPKKEGSIAKVARENGADAIILGGNSREFTGMNLQTGVANYYRHTKAIAIKYVE